MSYVSHLKQIIKIIEYIGNILLHKHLFIDNMRLFLDHFDCKTNKFAEPIIVFLLNHILYFVKKKQFMADCSFVTSITLGLIMVAVSSNYCST